MLAGLDCGAPDVAIEAQRDELTNCSLLPRPGAMLVARSSRMSCCRSFISIRSHAGQSWFDISIRGNALVQLIYEKLIQAIEAATRRPLFPLCETLRRAVSP